MVAGRSSTHEDSISLCCHSVTNHHITVGIAKSKLTIVRIHGQKSADNVGRGQSEGDRVL